MSSQVTPSEAAEVVLKERERERQKERQKKRQAQKQNPNKDAATSSDGTHAPTLEQVSMPKWDGLESGEVDESELDRRQRALSEQLDRRQREVHQQGKRLARVREELKALEQPIKADIMQLRERLEVANRSEITLVQNVNELRKQLFEKEHLLGETRQEKQTAADELIRVMADYERRKTDRLNEIADLVGGESAHNRLTNKPAKFTGFWSFIFIVERLVDSLIDGCSLSLWKGKEGHPPHWRSVI